MRLLLLLACAGPTKPDPEAAPEDTAGDTAGDTDTADTADTDPVDTADTDPADTDTDTDTDTAVWPVPDAPFVVEGCGFQDDGPRLFPIPDRDGDGVEELLVVVDADIEVYGTWLVPSTDGSVVYWDEPLHWAAAGTIQVLPDLDGDGLAELYAVDGDTVAWLAPDGSVLASTGVPTAFAPWHDVDGDGIDEVLVGASALSADGATTGYVAVAAAPGPDPTTWTALATIAADGLGAALAVGTVDADGDGQAEVVVTDAEDGYLLASTALDAGGSLADATLARFPSVEGRHPVPFGDADGGGIEDVVFLEEDAYDGPARLFAGEAPDAAVEWAGTGAFGETGPMAVGPDGAGGRALWFDYGDVRAYALGDLLRGVETLLVRGWSTRYASGFGASASSIWIAESTVGSGWDTRAIAAKLDPAAPDAVLAEVYGGGPGYGATADAAGLDDLDGDGAIDWWQLSEGRIDRHPVVPGATVTVCDGTSADATNWVHASPGDDLDGDRVPEVAWYGERPNTGLWSAAGTTISYSFSGWLVQLGCDLDGDGAGELQFVSHGRASIVSGAAWLRDGTDPSALSDIDDDGVCVGDLDGDGVSEVATAWLDVLVYSGASIAAGSPEAVAVIEGPYVGTIRALGDVDGDGLGDLSFLAFGGPYGTCLLTGADLLATPWRAVTELLCDARWTDVPADVDGDGVNELLTRTTDTITAWWPATDTTAVVWTAEDDARDEPLLDLVPDAFGPGRAAVVLGPDPIVVYALGE